MVSPAFTFGEGFSEDVASPKPKRGDVFGDATSSLTSVVETKGIATLQLR